MEFLSEIEQNLQDLKRKSQQLSDLRKSKGAKSQKVLDFRSTKEDVADFRIASGKLLHDSELKVQRGKPSESSQAHTPKRTFNAPLKTPQEHAQVFGVPTGKNLDSKSNVSRHSKPEELDLNRDEMVNMDDEKLQLIWRRMFSMSFNTRGDKVSRRDFLERICMEPELKEF